MSRQQPTYDENAVPFLDIEQLKREEKHPDRVKKKMFKIILAKCHDRIRKMNKTTDKRELVYDIPLFLPGYPGYELEEVNRFLVHNLSLNGVYANRLSTGQVYVSWKNQHIDYQQYKIQSQKMTPKHLNPYKISVSPLSDDHQRQTERDKGGDDPMNSPVMMLRYDNYLDDLVPVNRRKINDMYPDLNDQRTSLNFNLPPSRSDKVNKKRPSIYKPTENTTLPEYAQRYDVKRGSSMYGHEGHH